MKNVVIALVSLLLTTQKISSQTIGAMAPDILFSDVLNQKGSTNIDMKNKYLVVDFWATWCGPCIASFPHLNELSDKFSSDSVVFAIISSEEKGKVKKFLSKTVVKALHLLDSITETSRKGWKTNDLYGITAQAFAVESIPHTVVIDKNGILRWVGTSHMLTASILQDVLNGNTAKVQDEQIKKTKELLKNRQLRKQLFESLKKDTFQSSISSSVIVKVPYTINEMSAGMLLEKGKRFVEFGGHTIEFLYSYFTGSSYKRIDNFIKQDSGIFFRFETDTSYPRQAFNNEALNVLSSATFTEFITKTVYSPVWILRIVDREKFIKAIQPLDSNSGHSSSSSNDKELVFSNFTLKQIIPVLEDEFNIYIEPQKGDLIYRNGDFKIPKGTTEFVQKKLYQSFGIEMKRDKQSVIITEIVPRQKIK